MISNPQPGAKVVIHYAPRPAAVMPYHGAAGLVLVPGGGKPRNHLILTTAGRLVVVPAGNLRRPRPSELGEWRSAMMNNHYTSLCEYCGRRVGWWGDVLAMPNCPKCHKPPSDKTKVKLQADAKYMEEFRALAAKRAVDSTAAELIRKRVQAGLGFVNAGNLSGVGLVALAEIEQARRPPTSDEGQKLDALYSGETRHV